MRIAVKTALLMGHVLVAMILAALLAIDVMRTMPRVRLVGWWQRRLLLILRIRLSVTGNPHPGPRLTVANHVSWLDVPVIGSLEDTCFVAKSEVRDWPVAGTLAHAAGTFYIRRSKGGSSPLIEKLVPYLGKGGAVTVFPEGTTTDGSSVLDFHPRLLTAAIEAGVPVQPVALVYGPSAEARRLGPFIGDDGLIGHIARLLRSDGLSVGVCYFQSLAASEYSRDELARRARGMVSGHLTRSLGPGALELPSAGGVLGGHAVINL